MKQIPTSIPTVEEMLKFAMEQTEKTKQQLQKEINQFRKQFKAKIVRESDRLMTFRYLIDVLGIKPKLATVAPEEFIPLKQILNPEFRAKTGINTQGYIVNTWEFQAGKKQEKVYGFTVKDKTKQMDGMIFFDDAKKNWKEVNPKFGDFLQLGKCNLSVFENEQTGENTKTLRPTGWTKIDKLENPPYQLSELVSPVISLKENGSGLMLVQIVTVAKGQDYVACPYCFKGLYRMKEDKDGKKSKVYFEEGQTVTCEKCGVDVFAQKMHFVNVMLSDGEDDIEDVSFNPQMVKEYGDDFFYEGKFLYVYGENYKKKFRIRNFKSCDLDTEATRTTEEKLKERFTGSIINEASSLIPKILATSDKGMDKTEILKACKDMMKADEETTEEALKICIANGDIKFNVQTKRFLVTSEEEKIKTVLKTKDTKSQSKGKKDIDDMFSKPSKTYSSHPEE